MPVPIVYQNFIPPAIDAGNLNTVNNVVYTVIGDGTNAPLNAANVRANIGLGTVATQNTVPIANGGTGATTQTAAQTALDIPPTGFRAHNNGVSTNLTNSAFTTVSFSTEVFDLGSFFSGSSWTPPAGRPVTLSGSVGVLSAGGIGLLVISIFKNGVELFRGTTFATWGVNAAVTVSGTDLPNGTDVYTLRVFQNSGGAINTDGNSNVSWFSGARC